MELMWLRRPEYVNESRHQEQVEGDPEVEAGLNEHHERFWWQHWAAKLDCAGPTANPDQGCQPHQGEHDYDLTSARNPVPIPHDPTPTLGHCGR